MRFLIQKLMNWRYSGFSVYAGNRIGRDDKADNECAFDEGCRHPHRARPSIKAYGFATVRKHGFGIDVVRNQDDPKHYFGIVLLE